jgi:phospholipid/cholesterol/gamma-HCH transport system ATP-binding protein
MMETVLTFEDVMLPAGQEHDSGMENVRFTLRPGELVLVVAEPVRRLPLADAAQGLVAPEAGTIAFQGVPWAARSPDEAAAARAKIGRTFLGPAWLSNLDVDENITLKLRHHSTEPVADLESRALELAQSFGFAELPHKRPAWLDREELNRAQWVRALLGAPALLLLEFPELNARDEHLAALKSSVRESVDRGAAALWITADPRTWADDGLKALAKYRILDARWCAWQER